MKVVRIESKTPRSCASGFRDTTKGVGASPETIGRHSRAIVFDQLSVIDPCVAYSSVGTEEATERHESSSD